MSKGKPDSCNDDAPLSAAPDFTIFGFCLFFPITTTWSSKPEDCPFMSTIGIVWGGMDVVENVGCL